MADIGINFRATAGYVTDGANETYCLAETYPVTRGGVTFGWDSSIVGNSRDRSSLIDRRLAGINFTNTVGRYFQIDLPATGSYDAHCAAGDYSAANGANWDLRDDATAFVSLVADSVTAANYKDATDTTRSEANWPSQEAATNRTFASTTFKLYVRAVAAVGQNNVITHVRLVSAGSSAKPWHYYAQLG